MPTPVELFTDPISLAFFGLYAALGAIEALFPARPLPRMRGHLASGLLPPRARRARLQLR